jgi:hypothetical protein
MTPALRFRLGIDQLLTFPPISSPVLYMYMTPNTSSPKPISFDVSDTVPRHNSRLAFHSTSNRTTPSDENRNRPTHDIRQSPNPGHIHN